MHENRNYGESGKAVTSLLSIRGIKKFAEVQLPSPGSIALTINKIMRCLLQYQVGVEVVSVIDTRHDTFAR
jgi:hypothetical protein